MTRDSESHYTVLAGGTGAAKFLRGLIRIFPPDRIHIIANVGDDPSQILGFRWECLQRLKDLLQCRPSPQQFDRKAALAAVIATDARYRDDAARILAAQSPRALAGSPAHAAAYGLALLDLR